MTGIIQQLFAYPGASNMVGDVAKTAQFFFTSLIILFMVNVVISYVCGRFLATLINLLLGWAIIMQVMEITSNIIKQAVPFPVSGIPNINQLGDEFVRAFDSLSKFSY